jgi:uroporphyrinogen III methyltransferase / synthase
MRLGTVYLIGAGPGDPGLLTVRGLELLRRAQIIVFDQLVNPVLLEEASDGAVKIFAGKRAGRHCIAQSEINQSLIDHARLGYEVVRLKGGDPFVFGRGGEEAEALAAAGVPFEIVPGVSSAVAVPAYAGIPLTHRNYSSSFAVVTGHKAQKQQAAVEWAKLAAAVDTLVILMGLKNLAQITAELLSHGLAPETRIAVISRGTTDDQETITGTIADIVDKTRSMESPAVIVIGRVVELRHRLNWFATRFNRSEACWPASEEGVMYYPLET